MVGFTRVSRVRIGVSSRIRLGLVSLVPIYTLLCCTLNFTRPEITCHQTQVMLMGGEFLRERRSYLGPRMQVRLAR